MAGKPDKKLVFGATFDRSGPLKTQAPQLFAAVELAVEEVRVGPPLGVAVEPLSPENKFDEGDSATLKVCEPLARLLDPQGKNQPGVVDVLVGPVTSTSSERIYDRIGRAGGLVISPASTSPALSRISDSGGYFRTVGTDEMQGRVLGDLVVGEGVPGEKIVVVSRNDTYGQGLTREITGELSGFPQRTVKTMTYEPVNPDTETLRPIVDAVVKESPSAIVLVGYEAEMAELLKLMAAGGLRPDPDPGAVPRFYGTDGFLTGTLPMSVGSGSAGVAGLRGTIPYTNADLVTTLKNRIGSADYTFASQTYDAVIVTALAAAVAGSDEPGRIRDELNAVTRAGKKCYSYRECTAILSIDRKADIDYDGKSGPLDFTGDGEPCQGRYSVVRFTAQGSLEEYGTGDATYLCAALKSARPRAIN